MARDYYEEGYHDAKHDRPYNNPTSRYDDDWNAYKRGWEAVKGESNCFPGDALVLTPNGQSRIDSIIPGETVLSWNESVNRLVPRTVTAVRRHADAILCTITFAPDTGPFRVTLGHTVLTQRGWLRVSRIAAGDSVVIINKRLTQSDVLVTQLSRSEEVQTVYNLITDGEHNFVVGGVVAHNFTHLRRLRTFAHQCVFDKIAVGQRIIKEAKVYARV